MHEFQTVERQSHPNDTPRTVGEKVTMLFWDFCWTLFCSWTPKPLNPWRLLILRAFGAQIHGKPFVHQRARIELPWNLVLLDRACIGDRTHIYSLDKVTIGEYATVAQEAYVCCGSHAFDQDAMNLKTAAIEIGAYAFLGARCFIHPGICIGERAIVAACAVVIEDVSEGAIVAGNPAREISTRSQS